jgi:DNA-binding MarR family transcriptional regulator
MQQHADDALAASWHELMTRYNRLQCRLDRDLQAQHDLTSSEFEALQQLASAEEALTMGVLGEHVHVTQSALSRLVGRLEAAGLVSRTMCAEDRRSVRVCLTGAGRERFEAARPTQRAILREESLDCTAAAEGLLLPRP